jgi:hypothetical protein
MADTGGPIGGNRGLTGTVFIEGGGTEQQISDPQYQSGKTNGQLAKTAIPYLGAPSLYQGYMEARVANPTTPLYGRLWFLYNPSEIDFTYAGSTSNLPANQDDPKQLGIGITTTTTISFQIYFDRLLNMGAKGVLVDIQALEMLCGITPASPYFNMNNTFFCFSSVADFQFYGSITQFTVQYTHFDTRMVPARCAVGIQATRLGPTVDTTDPTAWLDATGGVAYDPNAKAQNKPAPAKNQTTTTDTAKTPTGFINTPAANFASD